MSRIKKEVALADRGFNELFKGIEATINFFFQVGSELTHPTVGNRNREVREMRVATGVNALKENLAPIAL